MEAGIAHASPQWLRLARRAKLLSWASLAYMALEGIVAVAAGIVAGSIALIGFGADSAIEGFASIIIVWRFTGSRTLSEDAERRAQKLVAMQFFILAPYVGIEAIRGLIEGHHPDESLVGIVLAASSLAVMPLLGRAKQRIGTQIESSATASEGKQNLLCAYLAGALLIGLLGNALFGAWWLDSVVALLIAYVAVQEGREAWRGDACCHDPAGRAKEKPAVTITKRADQNGGAMNAASDPFPTEVKGLPMARPPEVSELHDGDRFDLRIAPIAKRLGEATVRMLAYSGSIPGPILKVPEGSEIAVDIQNDADHETTVHWHGLRLENRYDGTHETQPLIPVGGKFSVRCTFPDPGVYWYHPHVREDYGKEMGLYGNILVQPADPDYWPRVHREVALTLDDILLEDGRVAPFSSTETTYAAMGRFGDVLLVNGETDLSLSARLGEVVRLYFTNTANTRVFKVALPDARMKLVGGDSGRVEHEQFVEEVILAPSERVVVDVLFDRAGDLMLEHHTPGRVYPLATIRVSSESAEPALGDQFEVLRTNADMADERERISPYLEAEPAKTLSFIAEMDMGKPEGDVIYACPMHPEVVSAEPDHCPQCGMKLVAIEAPDATYTCPMHPSVVQDEPGHCPECGMKLLPAQLVAEAADNHEHDHGHAHGSTEGGIEWEDDMVEVNRLTTPANMRWKLIDRETGAENAEIDWQFRVGDQVKIRLLNEMAGDHPMHHPFHVHGAGRFLVLSRDGVPEPNLVWKDTVLLRAGETVDILLEVTNPGRWMAHCHIAEHHESGMMFSFDVAPATE